MGVGRAKGVFRCRTLDKRPTAVLARLCGVQQSRVRRGFGVERLPDNRKPAGWGFPAGGLWDGAVEVGLVVRQKPNVSGQRNDG